MSKKISLLTLVLSIILAMLAVFMLTYVLVSDFYREQLAIAYAEDTTIENDDSEGSTDSFYTEKLAALEQVFDVYSYYDLDEAAVLDGILKGFTDGTGDVYAEYYTEEEFALFKEDSNGEMQGIGINIIYNADYRAIEVINVMPGSPALEAGVLPGDLIISVGLGEDAKDVSELGYTPAVALLQGKAGTMCEFVAVRGTGYEQRVEFSIERKYVDVQTVTSHIYAKNSKVGIIRIFEFDKKTPDQFMEALDSLTAQGAEMFVFDVRNNPGGDLTSICDILDYLLPEGPIIRMKNKAGIETSIDSGPEEFTAPMVVLCNGNTASAAELFTSAMMDYDKAVVIGEKTYGKGSMQTILPFSDGTGIKLTTKMYFPPFSEGYDGIGITPDIEIEIAEELKNVNLFKISDEEDNQLQRAVKYLEENN